jgi:hypothetical protein
MECSVKLVLSTEIITVGCVCALVPVHQSLSTPLLQVQPFLTIYSIKSLGLKIRLYKIKISCYEALCYKLESCGFESQ